MNCDPATLTFRLKLYLEFEPQTCDFEGNVEVSVEHLKPHMQMRLCQKAQIDSFEALKVLLMFSVISSSFNL